MNFRRKASLAALAISLAIPAASYATNGMFMIGYGTKSRGMGGVAMALPQDSLAGAVNPATIAYVSSGWDAGIDAFNPRANATLGIGSDSELRKRSEADLFPIPSMGGVMEYTDALVFGLSMVGAGGGGSLYEQNLFNSTTGTNLNKKLGVDLMIMQINPTVALAFDNDQSIGASLVIGAQRFEARGLDYFYTFTNAGLDATGLTDNSHDLAWGAGVRVGWFGRFLDRRLNLGVAATSKVYMTKFDKYKDLFADGGDMDTPPSIGAGFSFKVLPQLTVAMDITRTFYTQVNAIGNQGPSIVGSPFPVSKEQNALGLTGGLGFGWDNQTAYKLGLAYELNPKWTLRSGWNYGKSPIGEEDGGVLFNIVAPAVTQNHLTLGATYRYGPNSELSAAFVHAFRHNQFGPTLIGNMGDIEMEQDSLSVSYGAQF